MLNKPGCWSLLASHAVEENPVLNTIQWIALPIMPSPTFSLKSMKNPPSNFKGRLQIMTESHFFRIQQSGSPTIIVLLHWRRLGNLTTDPGVPGVQSLFIWYSSNWNGGRPLREKFPLYPVFFEFFCTWGTKTKLTKCDQIDQITLPPIVNKCFSTSEWFWHAKKHFVK